MTSVVAPRAPARGIPPIYPEATAVRLFVASDVLVAKPEKHYERRWLNPPGGLELTNGQQKRLRESLLDEPVPEAFAACFVPHHFFRFYDRSGRQVGEVAVCFCCSGVRAEPRLKLGDDRQLGANYKDLGRIVGELGSSTRTDCGKEDLT